MRIGIGHDTHRLAAGGPLRLGGIAIEHDRQLVGHSDADVLLHAITDALLGAVGAPDIGELFPNTDPVNRQRDSADFLREAVRQVEARGYHIVNLDSIIFAQRPRLAPHKQAIRERVAQLVGVSSDVVNVKAKTGESVGHIGREEAISAECVVLLANRSARD